MNHPAYFFLSIVKSTDRKRSLFYLLGVLPYLLASVHGSYAQQAYPKDYFKFPILPGQINYLSGNMGELRPNHFHAGLDIKTQGKEGLPVYAAAEGYISRIKVAKGGYGNALYITHPNGYITVYGHLKSYNQAIGNYLRKQQYEQQSFEIELVLEPNQIPVQKGDIVGLSGNTGGSGGPHLHFEIRDLQDNVLNPLYFGFTEIKDHTSPIVSKVAVRALDLNGRVQGDFGRNEFTPQKVSSTLYTVKQPVAVWGQIGLEVLASDLSDDSQNRNGISCIEVKVDGEVLYSHHLSSFSFETSKHINTHINYEEYMHSGQRFQKCYVSDGNELNTYKTGPGRGKFFIQDDQPHPVVVSMWDAHQNVVRLNMTLKGTPPSAVIPVFKASAVPAQLSYKLSENILVVKAKNSASTISDGLLYTGSSSQPLPLAYVKNNERVYLWDLRKALPDSVQLGANTLVFKFKKMIPSNSQQVYESDSINILFEEHSLFDTLYLETAQRNNLYLIGNSNVPLRENINIRLKPSVDEKLKAKTAVYAVKGSRLVYQGGTWAGNEINFKAKELGGYTLAVDNIAPFAKLQTKSPSQVTCRISDNLSGIESYKATINGEWLLMQYDYKTNLIWSDRREGMSVLKGQFRLEVKDYAGNLTVLESVL